MFNLIKENNIYILSHNRGGGLSQYVKDIIKIQSKIIDYSKTNIFSNEFVSQIYQEENNINILSNEDIEEILIDM